MIRVSRKYSSVSGFSLFELAIIIGIFGVALTAIIAIYNQYSKQVAYTNTMARRVNAEAALGRFYALNNRLPCPADNSLPSSDPMAGVEQCAERDRHLTTTFDASRYSIPLISGHGATMTSADLGCNAAGGICRLVGARQVPRNITTPAIDIRTADGVHDTVLRGGLPFVTLGMSPNEAIDGYGGRLTYAVTEFFTGNALRAGVDELATLRPAGSNLDIRDFGGAITVLTYADGVANADSADLQTAAPPSEYDAMTTGTDNMGANVSYVEHPTTDARIIRSWRTASDAGGFMQTRNSKARPLVTGDPSPINSFSMALISHGPNGAGAFTSSGSVKRPCGTGFDGIESVNCQPLTTFIAATHRSTNEDSALFFDDTFVSTSYKDQNDRWEMASAEASIKTKTPKVAIGKTTVRSGATVDVNGAVRMEDYNEAGTLIPGGLGGNVIKNVNATSAVEVEGEPPVSRKRGFQPVQLASATGISCGQGITKGLRPNPVDKSLPAINCETRINLDGPVNVGDCETEFGNEFPFFVGLTSGGNKICQSISGVRNDAYCTDLHESAPRDPNPSLSYKVGQCYGTGETLCGGPPGSTGAVVPPATSCPDSQCYDSFNATPGQHIFSASSCSVYNYMTGHMDTIKRCKNAAGTSTVRYSTGTAMNTCPPKYSAGGPHTGGPWTSGETIPIDVIGDDGPTLPETEPPFTTGPGGDVPGTEYIDAFTPFEDIFADMFTSYFGTEIETELKSEMK